MNDNIPTMTKSFIDSTHNDKEDISTPIIKQVKIDKSTQEKIDYGRTRVECKIIEFEIKHS